MPANATHLPRFGAWIDQLACPACLCALRLEEGTMVCAGCGRIFPVVDEIPVLIAERAEARTARP